MTLPGGAADKLGNRYETWWTLSELVRMLRNQTEAIRIEDPGFEKSEFVVTAGSRRELHQAKRSHPNGKWGLRSLETEGLLEVIGRQLAGNDDRFVFVSGSDAPELVELCDAARDSESVEEFKSQFLAAERREQSLKRLIGTWACDVPTARERLRRIEVRTIGEPELADKVQLGAQLLFLADPHRVTDTLRGIAGDSVHRTITRHGLVDDLRRRGFMLRCLTDPAAAGAAVRTATDRFLGAARRRFIRGQLVPRSAAEPLSSRLSGEASDTVITGRAGSGKTACVVQIADALLEREVPVLAFRLDRLVSASTTVDLGRRLDLEESPILALAAAAEAAGQPAVLIVDQLDAVSTVSGRTSGAFDLVEQLVHEARGAEPATIHVVVVCREFDWQNDSRLRRLLPDSHAQVDVTQFTIDEVKRILDDAGFQAEAFRDRQLKILALPQNLSIFLEADFDPSATPTFVTATDIFDRYWDFKRAAVEERFPDTGGHWTAVMNALCDEMTAGQQLSVARERLDGFPAGFLSQLASEGVVTFDGRRYGFGHESFLDYIFARKFVIGTERLTEFLKASEQHLFRRAQVRQVLAYFRDRDRARYARELCGLYSDDAIRPHLKDLAFALLADVPNPTDEEWAIWQTWIDPALEAIATGSPNSDKLSALAWRRFFGSRPWFADIDRRGIVADWLDSDGEAIADMAVNYLWVHHRHSSERVAELLEPYAERGGNWASRLRALMERAETHGSRRFFDLFLRLLANGALDDTRDRVASNGTFWSMLYSLGQEWPEWVPEVVAHRLRRRFAKMGVGEDDLGWAGDDHDSFAAELIARSAKKAPRAFVRHVLPVVLEISDSAAAEDEVAPRRDRVWRLLFKSEPFGVRDACLSGLADSLATLGSEAECDLQDVIDELRRRDTYTGNHLLLALYGGAAETLADEAVTTLCEEPWRFECGFSDSTYWSARETIRVLVSHCSPGKRERLESVILDYVAPYERSSWGYKELGRARFALLSAIPAELRSENGNRRARELARKFGEPEEEPRGISFQSIASPIANGATERMSDEQWLGAIAKYRSVDRRVSGEGIVGGARQLAERLGDRTVEDPERFARLALKLPGDVNPVYLDAMLVGLKVAAIPTELKLEVCRKALTESCGPCGRSIVDVLGGLEVELPDDAVQMLHELATGDEDPEGELWQEEAHDGQRWYDGDPHTAGINTTRGRAADVITDLIVKDAACVERFSATVARMVEDRSASVRACVAGTVCAITRHDRGLGMSLFQRMDLSEDRLLTTPHVCEFISWGLGTSLGQMRPLVERMLRAQEPDVRRVGGGLAGLAALRHDGAADLAAAALSGDAKERLGLAEVAAARLGDSDCRGWSESRLVVQFDDEDDDVRRAAASCFRDLPDVALEAYGDLIAAFCDSRAFPETSFWLLHALEESRRRLPGTTCLVCRRLLECVSDEEGNSRTGRFGDTYTVSKLIFRTYQQHADDEWTKPELDLIDLLCLEGVAGAGAELERFER